MCCSYIRRRILAPALVAAVLPGPNLLHAQASPKQATAVPIEGAVPRIDGRMDDPAWAAAQVIHDFTQSSPDEGAEPTQRTEVYILFSGDALYVGAKMFSNDPNGVARPVTRRDGFSNAEQFTVALDPYLDRRTAYSFGITSGGVRLDAYHAQDNEHRGRQNRYDPVWDATAQVDSIGWTAEMRIPFSQLRFNEAPEQVWGMNLRRWTPALHESVAWVMVPRAETGYSSRFGTLQGLVGVQPPARVEMIPYVAGAATAVDRDPADPFDQVLAQRFGADAKIGVGPNLTLDLTINPDFGQVEADPAEVNLSAFETFFDERRPFFIEGNELLSGLGPDYYYSRRIGARPSGSASGDFVDSPDNTTIAAAAKLTGRMASGLSVGALASVTPRERAQVYDVAGDRFQQVSVESPSGYGVLRLQQEFGASASTVGATLTGVQRSFGDDTGLASLLHESAFSGGADWRLRFSEGMYELTGFLGFSHVVGDSAAIVRTQRSSRHYFQRPDADYLRVDSSRTALTGYTASFRADKNAGERILWGAQVSTTSPGFEINDLGRLNAADEVDFNADVQVRETQPGKLLRNWQIGTSVRGGYNYGGDRQSLQLSNNTRITLLNFWSVNMGLTRRFRAQSDFLTRGGPSMGTGSGWNVHGRLSNGFSAAQRWRVNGRYGTDELGGWNYNVGGGITLRPAPPVQLSIDPSYNRSVNARQYVTSRDGGSAATFGRRYVFAFIERSTLAARVRVDYAFTPDLTIEGYAEPFASSGRYHDFGELEAARSRDLRTYGESGTMIAQEADGNYTVTDGTSSFAISNPNFNVLSFRSNLVVRWEWLPGSTFFLVWQQDRAQRDANGTLVSVGSLQDALAADGNNFFAVKLTYWFAVN